MGEERKRDRGREGELGRGGEETRTQNPPNCLPKTSRLAAQRAAAPMARCPAPPGFLYISCIFLQWVCPGQSRDVTIFTL